MLLLFSPSGTATVAGAVRCSLYGPNSALRSSCNFAGSTNGNIDTALENNALSLCTMSTSSRFCEETWKSRGPGSRHGISLGTFRQIVTRAGSYGNGSSSTSPNNRDNASGTTFSFPATRLTVNSKFWRAIAHWVSMFEVSCMWYRWVDA